MDFEPEDFNFKVDFLPEKRNRIPKKKAIEGNNAIKIPEGVLDIQNSAKGDDESSDSLSHQERKVSITSPSMTELPHLTSHKGKSVFAGRKRNKVTFQYFPNPKEKFVAGRSVSLKSYDKAPQKPQRRRSNSIP